VRVRIGVRVGLCQMQFASATCNVSVTCSTLTSFLNEVQHQAGKSLSAAQVAQLGAAARRIRAVLNC
jgi:hypothetical protein